MERILSILAVALAVASLAVAWTGRAAAPAEPGAVPRASGSSPADDKPRLSDLTLASLMRRVQALEEAPRAVPRAAGDPTGAPTVDDDLRQQVAALRADVDALLSGRPHADGVARQVTPRPTVSSEVASRYFEVEQSRTKRLRSLTKDAQLTEAQHDQLQAILDKEAVTRLKLMETPSTSKDQLRDLRRQTDETAKAALTPEQYSKYQKMRQGEFRDAVPSKLSRQ
ncbi:MAG: hypothetical protein QM765_18655 [Myxococcales bacterium]